jgi:hypothetical protein
MNCPARPFVPGRRNPGKRCAWSRRRCRDGIVAGRKSLADRGRSLRGSRLPTWVRIQKIGQLQLRVNGAGGKQHTPQRAGCASCQESARPRPDTAVSVRPLTVDQDPVHRCGQAGRAGTLYTAALGQMELEIKRERILDSVSKRRAAGKDLGGRKVQFTDRQIRSAATLIESGHQRRELRVI